MGMEEGEEGSSKVLVYLPGEKDFIRFQGITKMDSLTKFFDSIVDGSYDLQAANDEAAKEEFVVTEEELETERQQEAQRIALLHGGFTDFIDFEEAIKQHGPDYHGKQGYAGGMGTMPQKKVKAKNDKAKGDKDGKASTKNEDPEHRTPKHQKEEAAKSADAPEMLKAGGGEQVVLEVSSSTAHVKTPATTPTAASTPDAAEPVAEPSPTPFSSTDHDEETLDTSDDIDTPDEENMASLAEPGSTSTDSAIPESIPTTETENDPTHVKDEL